MLAFIQQFLQVIIPLFIKNYYYSHMHLTHKKGISIEQLQAKFKNRQEQNKIQEALVYLKLRQYNCPAEKALIFATKKNRAIDGTLQKDGPPNYRKLFPVKPSTVLVNGWVKGGEKLKYKSTLCFQQFLKQKQSSIIQSVNQYNKKQRQQAQEMRRTNSQSLLNLNLKNSRQSMERIGSLRQQIMKQRQNRNINLKFRDLDLQQSTKSYFKDVEELNEQGLVIKAGAFNHLIYDNEIQFVNSDTRGKTLNSSQVQAFRKRESIHQFQKKHDFIHQTLNQTEQEKLNSPLKFRSTTSFSKSTIQKKRIQKEELKLFQRKIQKLIKQEYLIKPDKYRTKLKLTLAQK